MRREQVKAIVAAVVSEYVAQKRSGQKLFVLLTGRSTIQGQILHFLEELTKQNVQITLASCQLWHQTAERLEVYKHIKLDLAEDENQLLQNCLQANALVVPNLTLSMLAKLSLLIDDSLASWLVLQRLVKGKSVILAIDQIEGDVEQLLSIPAALEDRRKEYVHQLQQSGARLTVLKKMPQVIKDHLVDSEEKRSVLLAKHIEQVADRGVSDLTLPENVLITPLARDLSKELKISLTKQRKGGLNDRR